jgi:zinc/manganese transport system ATP-binding protein
MHTGNDVLTVDRVSVSFPGHHVLKNVNFSLAAGQFCGLIGSNGSGKTTLLRTILGFQKPSSGGIRIDHARNLRGRGFHGLGFPGLGFRGLPAIGYVPQKTPLDPDIPLRARDLVTLGLYGHRLGLAIPSRRSRYLVDEMLHAVDADAFADRRIGNLSGGQQQRILIAHALIRRPKLLLLDEPLANLDIRSANEIVALLHRLSAEHRISVLLSAHDMNPLLPVMDRIVYLAHGRAASGRTDEVVRTEVLSALYGYHIDVIRVHGRVLVIAAGAAHEIPAALAQYPLHVAAVP